MAVNLVKLGLAAVIALACVVALLLDPDNSQSWAVPILGIVVGYVVGNAEVTNRSGATAPIVSKE